MNTKKKDILTTKIEKLNLSQRTLRYLNRVEIKTLEDISKKTKEEIFYYLGCDGLSYEELTTKIHSLNLLFAEENQEQLSENNHNDSQDYMKKSSIKNNNITEQVNLLISLKNALIDCKRHPKMKTR